MKIRVGVGLVLTFIGLAISLVFLVALIGSPPPEWSTTVLIALFCVLAPFFVFGGGGALLAFQSFRNLERARQAARARALETQLRALIKARGQISLGHAMAELNMSYEEGKAAIYGLVHSKQFPGYIDWDAQMLYSAELGELGNLKCPNCGGVRQVMGKGIVKCGHCGNQEFVSTN